MQYMVSQYQALSRIQLKNILLISTKAQATQTHPLYLLIPTVVGTSLAFMLPVATPPNAIAFSFGRLTVFDMVNHFSFSLLY